MERENWARIVGVYAVVIFVCAGVVLFARGADSGGAPVAATPTSPTQFDGDAYATSVTTARTALPTTQALYYEEFNSGRRDYRSLPTVISPLGDVHLGILPRDEVAAQVDVILLARVEEVHFVWYSATVTVGDSQLLAGDGRQAGCEFGIAGAPHRLYDGSWEYIVREAGIRVEKGQSLMLLLVDYGKLFGGVDGELSVHPQGVLVVENGRIAAKGAAESLGLVGMSVFEAAKVMNGEE